MGKEKAVCLITHNSTVFYHVTDYLKTKGSRYHVKWPVTCVVLLLSAKRVPKYLSRFFTRYNWYLVND